jgi:FkbM family methyltransferase
MHFIDVGANTGLYSILANKLVGAHGQVWAFEPSSETYQWLLANLRCNECTLVVPIKVALSDRDGDDLILRSDPGFGDAYRYLERRDRTGSLLSGERRNDSRTEPVTTATLDCYAERHDIRKIDFIKVDIEGGEYAFFVGARRVLTENQDVVVMFESSPDWCARAGHQQEEVFALLRRLGFGLYSWNRRSREWEDSDSSVMRAEMVWATRDRRRLPTTVSSPPSGAPTLASRSRPWRRHWRGGHTVKS